MSSFADVRGIVGPDRQLSTYASFQCVGMTGGIGSGKSFVGRIFQSLGIPVYDADSRAKWLIANHALLKQRIKALLGEKAYDTKGNYDTAFVSSVVFQNEELLTALNALVHPVVQQDSTEWFSQIKASGRFPYAIKEAAIMSKASVANGLDCVIVVTASETTRITRVLQRDPQRTEQAIRAIMKRQLSDSERLQIANYTLNNEEQLPLLPQILALHTQLVARVNK